MEKSFATDDHAELIAAAGGHAVTFFERASRGVHMTKSASDVVGRTEIQENMPPDDHFGVHLISLGMEEHMGPNRNGDSWSEKSVNDHHKSFEKFGTVFREHKNRDPKTQGVGMVKLARVNPRMKRGELIVWVDKDKAPDMYKTAKEGKELSFSMSCFPAGTEVMLPDGTTKSIEEITEGDEVLTHKGRVGKVSHAMCRDYVGVMVEMRAWGLADPLISTGDHPVWARPALRRDDPCPVCGEKFKSLSAHLWQKKDAQHQSARRDYSRHTEGFWPAHYLSTRDYVRTAVPRNTNGCGSEELAIVAGYYLAEGSLSVVEQRKRKEGVVIREYDCKRVEWTFGLGEREFAEEVADCVEALGHSRPGIFKEPKYSRIKVCSHSRALHDWLLEHCGKYSHGKKLSRELMEWEPALQRLLLGKWLNGDGHWCNTNHIVGGSTVSRSMATQLMLIAARCDISATLSACAKKTEPILGNPAKAPRKRAYSLRVHGVDDIEKLRGAMTKLPDIIAPRQQTWTKDVSHLKHQPAGTTAVYAATDKTRVFVERGFIYRQIRKVKVGYGALRVYDLTVPTDSGFQAAGIGVSNCRLPADECSCCRKKSRTTDDYCSHLKDSMLQWVPGFEKFAYARNEEDVKFFDISEVKRRADRIATYLGYYFPDSDMAKAASSDRIITGAQWAEYQFGPARVTPFSPWEELTLEKLAAAEEFIRHADAETLTTLARMAPQDLTREQAEILAQPDFRSVGGELAKRAMIISFPTFASIVTGKTRDELEKIAEYQETVSAKLPTLLTDLMRSGGCCCGEEVADAVAPDEVGCSFSPGKDAIDRLMAETGGSLGMDQESTSGRAVRVTIIKSASLRRASETVADLDPYYEGLVSAYGHYLVKAAHQAKDLPGVSEGSFFRGIAAGLTILSA